MKLIGWIGMGLAAFSLAILLPACSKGGPCSSGGMAVDERPLPADWAAVAPAPDEAVACHAADGSTDAEYTRSYELGSSPEEGFEQWKAHLASLGWTQGEDTSSDRGYALTFEREGATLELYVSRDVENKGWSTLEFRAQ